MQPQQLLEPRLIIVSPSEPAQLTDLLKQLLAAALAGLPCPFKVIPSR